MKYAYYPGCSLQTSAEEYDVSCRETLKRLGVELFETPGWTCCGASAVEPVSKLLTYALSARNLALTEREAPGQDLLVPCSACYLNLLKAQRAALADKAALAGANALIGHEGLAYTGKTGRVRHLLDVLINDVGPKAIGDAVQKPLTGISVAPYYGCQILRPYRVFDDPERPTSMEPILAALGAAIHPWNMGGRCCGASLMATHKEAALASVGQILKAAATPAGDEKETGSDGADVIATVCPMCQMNLDGYQGQALRAGGVGRPVTILYLSQLIGLAMGLPEDQTLMDKNLVVTDGFRSKLAHPPDVREHHPTPETHRPQP